MILFIKHIAIEGPGTMEEFLLSRDRETRTVDLSAGESLPVARPDLEAVVVLGGPMNVYEEESFPFLADENRFIQQVLERDIPFLGICLGSQLLAKACRSRVFRSPVKEIGFYPLALTLEGQRDPLFDGLPEGPLTVFQWHEDTFDLPSRAVLMARGTRCTHQAFRAGSRAYGFQFHIEITGQSIDEWCRAYMPGDAALRASLQKDFAQNKEKFHSQAITIYNNFLKIIG